MRLTSQFARLSASLFLLFNIGCATVKIPDFKAYIEEPAKKTGFGVSTVSHEEIVIPAAEWKEKKKRAIHIFSEDWLILKRTIRENCHTNKCQKAIGAFDGLFLAIDHALKQVTIPQKGN